MNPRALGAYGVIAIIAFLIGLFVHQCPLDGNPVGFHIYGTVKLDNATALNVGSCATNTCTLAFDLRTDEKTAAVPSPCPSKSNCFHFKDNGSTLLVTIKDKDPQRTYNDFVDGTVELK